MRSASYAYGLPSFARLLLAVLVILRGDANVIDENLEVDEAHALLRIMHDVVRVREALHLHDFVAFDRFELHHRLQESCCVAFHYKTNHWLMVVRHHSVWEVLGIHTIQRIVFHAANVLIVDIVLKC